MKFNALQKYLLKVYAIAIIILTIIVPTYTSGSNISYNFIIFGSENVSFSFLLIEYLALTLALVASILGTSSKEKK